MTLQISLSGGRLDVYVRDETLPRRFENISLTCRLGPGYQWMDLKVINLEFGTRIAAWMRVCMVSCPARTGSRPSVNCRNCAFLAAHKERLLPSLLLTKRLLFAYH